MENMTWVCDGCGSPQHYRTPRRFINGMHYCPSCSADVENARRAD